MLESESSDFSGSVSVDKSAFIDAPNRLPNKFEESSLWPMWTVISDQGDYSSMLRLQGDVSDLDPIDIYLVSIESDNGTIIRSDPEMGGANIQIQELRGEAGLLDHEFNKWLSDASSDGHACHQSRTGLGPRRGLFIHNLRK